MSAPSPYKFFFAPLQGYTDALHRRVHHEVVGGVDAYFTPFVRWEHGGVPNKALRDVQPDNNVGVPTVPQVIARDRDEFCRLCDLLQGMGWRRIDLNMGCPFPMQVHAGRGSGLLSHPDQVAAIAEEMRQRSEVVFSLKMRLGWECANEAVALLPLFDEVPLAFITMHPRLGRQQYKGIPDMEQFAQFYAVCKHPLVYNGDLTTVEQVNALLAQFPKLHGVMTGRGLLGNPALAQQWRGTETVGPKTLTLQMHDRIFDQASHTLCGEAQLLARMHTFWEYQEAHLDKKSFKKLMKSGNLKNYLSAVENLAIISDSPW